MDTSPSAGISADSNRYSTTLLQASLEGGLQGSSAGFSPKGEGYEKFRAMAYELKGVRAFRKYLSSSPSSRFPTVTAETLQFQRPVISFKAPPHAKTAA